MQSPCTLVTWPCARRKTPGSSSPFPKQLLNVRRVRLPAMAKGTICLGPMLFLTWLGRTAGSL